MRCLPSCCSSISLGGCWAGTKSLASGCTNKTVYAAKYLWAGVATGACAAFAAVVASPFLALSCLAIGALVMAIAARRFGICNQNTEALRRDEESTPPPLPEPRDHSVPPEAGVLPSSSRRNSGDPSDGKQGAA